ncbi:MFS transporter [Paenibacillus sp. P2(2022)]|uniref:MFS transporter n=1 Tax=Paenibacillus TaxID=44249 RepID=UPI00042EC09E|nr:MULTISPECIES: MFS transporter [Paenibacillus]AHM67236.1 major facilitator superfamily permease [Paenibacillus polymyxa SQR-21]AIY08026.1 MFS transporter permease [Paenibacillus polymyxa]AUS27843.1 major facilitator superfamily permease [Paenibacillus polymyxa]KAF6585986.1 MFS transporter [Paenibacillus sp. EKM211P]KJK31288.1 MFS transporter permease [Paenibacillus polymyxa]
MNIKNKIWFKTALLSISLVLTSASAISAVIPMMLNQFPGVSSSLIESVVTIPSFSMMLFVLLSGPISSRMGKKNTVLLGLLLVVIGGILPMLTTNITWILALRLVLGAGLGMFNSLAVSLISDFFEGDERAQLVGFQSAVQGLGSSLATFVAGQLALIDWPFAFLCYAITIPIALLFFFIIPEPERGEPTVCTTGTGNKSRGVSLPVLGLGAALFLFMTFIMIVYTKTGIMIAEKSMPNAGFLGTALTLFSLSTMIAGFLFGRIYKWFRNYAPFISSLLTATGFVLLWFAQNVTMVTVAMLIIGFSFALFIPYIFTILTKIVPKGSETISISIAMVGSNLGAFASPYVIKLVGVLSGNETASFSFLVSAIVFMIAALLCLGIAIRGKGSKTQTAVHS